VLGKGRRSSRLLVNPFQGIREPAACLSVMLEHRYDASVMLRAVGVHTLQKAVHSSRRPMQPAPEHITTVSRWLSALLEHEPVPASNAEPAAPTASDATSLAPSSAPAVAQLRERGAVLLLYSLAKLRQARDWRPLLEDESVRAVLALLLQRLHHLVPSLDAQVRPRPAPCASCCAAVPARFS
jgi:hypothetical protein